MDSALHNIHAVPSRTQFFFVGDSCSCVHARLEGYLRPLHALRALCEVSSGCMGDAESRSLSGVLSVQFESFASHDPPEQAVYQLKRLTHKSSASDGPGHNISNVIKHLKIRKSAKHSGCSLSLSRPHTDRRGSFARSVVRSRRRSHKRRRRRRSHSPGTDSCFTVSSPTHRSAI